MNGMLYVYKSMLNKLQNDWRTPIIFALLVAMITAVFLSRAVLSVTMIVFIAFSFFHQGYKQQLIQFVRSPFLVGLSLLFLVPLLSGLWSTDTVQWSRIMRIKLPLLFLPMAFAAPFHFSTKHWQRLCMYLIVMVTLGTAWCMIQYAGDIDLVNDAYLRAKTMLTPLENDHVRFSWLTAIAILACAYLCWTRRNEKDLIFWILAGLIIWLIIFLHVLAARTGLFTFYLLLLGCGGSWLYNRGRLKYLFVLVALFFVIPVAAYLLLPSFHNKIAYFRYEYPYLKDKNYLPGANDAVRVISIRAGWQLMNQRPLSGVGFGDIHEEMNKIYTREYPAITTRDKILPSNEWLMYGSGCGWPGFLILTAVLLLPFFLSASYRPGWYMLNATVALGMFVDISLEVQYGVFLYVFVIGLAWKWLVTEKK